VKWLVAICALCLALASASSVSASDPSVVVMKLEGAIQPAALRYVERGVRTAEAGRAKLMIIELDTPGGTLVSLRSMTTAITQSRVPVAVYVTPAGARAASAGFFLLMAADVAAVAPGTNTGAAHPVTIGQSPAGQAEGPNVAKAVEDAAALVRSLAQARERNVDWAERAVRDSLAYSADEAL
jgi:membrane-bound serine protease (ClpP class)